MVIYSSLGIMSSNEDVELHTRNFVTYIFKKKSRFTSQQRKKNNDFTYFTHEKSRELIEIENLMALIYSGR